MALNGSGAATMVQFFNPDHRVGEFDAGDDPDGASSFDNPTLIARRGADLSIVVTLAAESADAASFTNGVTIQGVGSRTRYYFEPALADATTETAVAGDLIEDLGFDKLGSAFASLDKDGSGKLVRSEMRALIAAWWDSTGRVTDWVRSGIEGQVDALLSDVDEDGDGLVSHAEFTAAVKSHAATLTKYEAALAGGQCCTEASSPSQVNLTIRLPADMAVGEYRINAHLGGGSSVGLAKPSIMMVLFNPWSEACPEYIPDEAAADEYVMNEGGMAHFGTWNNSGRMYWNLGQFEPGVLAACRKILKWLKESDRADPVLLSRGVTRAINTQGQGGVSTHLTFTIH